MADDELYSPSIHETRTLALNSARIYHKNRILERLLHLFSDVSDVNRVQESLMDVAMDTVPSEAGSLIRTRNKKGDLVFVAARGPVGDKIVGIKMKAGEGLVGACARDRRVITVSDVKSDPRHAAAIAKKLGFETRSILAAPIIHDGRCTGVIELVNRKEGDEFQRHEIELIERVARATGAMLALAGGRKK